MNYIGITRMRLDDAEFLDHVASALRTEKQGPGEAAKVSPDGGREEARSFLMAHFPQMKLEKSANDHAKEEAAFSPSPS